VKDYKTVVTNIWQSIKELKAHLNAEDLKKKKEEEET